MSQLLVIFERDGREIERQVARDGERAAQMAVVMIAGLGLLEPGDVVWIEED
ncbi:MAG TPA: hypothetical protein VKC66_28350 [Xanthobacteraceae bacterium]|nr:hypothetical protein [Xanthobacteraceae bacterium]